jgi:DNA-binding beta-propeller fold protein YncE
LPSAPVARALGKVSQKPGTAGCISETGTGGACQDGTALNGAFDLAASADGENRYVSSNAQTRWRSSTATGSRGVGSEAGYGRLRVGERHGGACRHATALSGAHRLAASPDGMNVYVATGVSNAVAVFDRDSVTGR